MNESKLIREENPRFRRFNITFKMESLTGKRFRNLENFLKFMDNNELKEYNRFIKEIEGKIDDLKRKLRTGRFF